MSITGSLHDHHKSCDDDFAAAEEAALGGDWQACSTSFHAFSKGMLAHFNIEEEILFPAFEQQTGMAGGPTQVMRHEHGQIRDLLDQLESALSAKDAQGFGGAAETLLVLMQQHNMKEENILYPMCEQALGNQAELAEKIEAGLRG